MGVGIMTLFQQIHNEMKDPIARTITWLVYKVVCVIIIHFFAKVACYAMSNDVQFQLVIMMLVTIIFQFHVTISVCLCVCTRHLLSMGDVYFSVLIWRVCWLVITCP